MRYRYNDRAELLGQSWLETTLLLSRIRQHIAALPMNASSARTLADDHRGVARTVMRHYLVYAYSERGDYA